MLSNITILAMFFVVGGAMGSILPAMDTMRSDPILEDNSLEPNDRLNLVPSRKSWVKILKSPPPTIRRVPGVTLELECEAIGSPAPNVHWLRDNMPIVDEDDYENNEIFEMSSNEMARTVSRLVINNMIPIEKGTSYTCVARSDIKTAYSSTNVYGKGTGLKPQNLSELIMMKNDVLSAISKPRIVSFYSVLMDVIGSTMIIPCKTIGNPRPEIYWLDNEDAIIPKQDSRRKILSSGALMIQGVRWADMGGYTCVAKNHYAKDTISTFVYPMAKDD